MDKRTSQRRWVVLLSIAIQSQEWLLLTPLSRFVAVVSGRRRRLLFVVEFVVLGVRCDVDSAEYWFSDGYSLMQLFSNYDLLLPHFEIFT